MKYYEDLLKLEVFTFEDAQAVIGNVEATKDAAKIQEEWSG